MTEAAAKTLSTFIAFDFGMKRTGVAVGNRIMGTAQPQGSIHAQGGLSTLLSASKSGSPTPS
jgi:RNase H-fold protein (predicted Holliday junction resolvase)